ncbi:MAG: hypothetical protein ACOYMG_18540, partial [Candidatus Methylumidiphilus sp.]
MRGETYQLPFDREAVFSISGFLINGKAGANIGSQAGAWEPANLSDIDTQAAWLKDWFARLLIYSIS